MYKTRWMTELSADLFLDMVLPVHMAGVSVGQGGEK